MLAQETAVQELLERIEALERRVAELEGRKPQVPAAVAAPPATAVEKDDIPEDVLAVISAAVASFLGVKAHVKQIRLVGREAWAQQGRVSIMASHRWAMHRS
jgi:methylmalonyl-CoA carboxyltransferase large subunit